MKQEIMILLPEKLYILRPRKHQTIATDKEEYNLYFSNMIQPYSLDYDVLVDCEYGKNFGHCWRMDTFPDEVTSFPIGIRLYNAYGALLAEKKATVEVIDKPRNVETPFYVLAVGDSMTQSEKYLQHIRHKLSNVQFVGSRSFNGELYHEGRGGWSFASYFCGTREKGPLVSPFLFPKGISGSAYFGDIGYYQDIANDNHDTYCFDGFFPEQPKEGQYVSDKNQMYIWKNGALSPVDMEIEWEFSISKYIERRRISRLDAVTILMGANDLQVCFYEESDAKIGVYMDYMEKFIQSVREYDAHLPVVINLPILGAEQHAWGKQMNCWGTQKMYRYNILQVCNRLIETYGSRDAEGIYISPMVLTIDPVYGFPREGYKANLYVEDVVTHQSNWVHPNVSGYHQMGDALAGVLEKIRQK